MRHTPTYLLQKIQQSTDPYAPVRQPEGSVYKAARWIRDMPIDNTALTAGLLMTFPFQLMNPLALPIYSAAAAYSTGRDIGAAIPSFAKTLMRLGGRRHEFSAPMVDTSAARSMRQASLRAIHDSGYMLRSVISHEARIMHR